MGQIAQMGIGPDEIALLQLLAATLPETTSNSFNNVYPNQRIIALAQATKCLSLISGQLSRYGDNLDVETMQTLARDIEETTHSNLAQLVQTLACQDLLKHHKIPAIAFKGVVRQQQLYGRIDVRRSCDIDLLVARNDYDKAQEILLSAGYRPGVNPASRWWHNYLGESPYIAPAPYKFIIDLHHRLQQPGAPAPCDINTLVGLTVTVEFGSRHIQTLSPDAALLVSVISYSKALRERQPWLIYAHEIATARTAFTAAQEKSFMNFVTRQNMLRLTQDAFDETDSLWKSVQILSKGNDINRRDAAIICRALGMQTERMLRRSGLRWRWLDGALVSRSVKFVRLAAGFYTSNYVRWREERSGLQHM